jgi:hypothetical protein
VQELQEWGSTSGRRLARMLPPAAADGSPATPKAVTVIMRQAVAEEAAAAGGGGGGGAAAGPTSIYHGQAVLDPCWRLAGQQQLGLVVEGLGEVWLQLSGLQPSFGQLPPLALAVVKQRVICWTSAIANRQLDHWQMVQLRVQELEPARAQLHGLLVSAILPAAPELQHARWPA